MAMKMLNAVNPMRGKSKQAEEPSDGNKQQLASQAVDKFCESDNAKGKAAILAARLNGSQKKILEGVFKNYDEYNVIKRELEEIRQPAEPVVGGGRRRTKNAKYYNKRRRTKRRRSKRRRSNKRRA